MTTKQKIKDENQRLIAIHQANENGNKTGIYKTVGAIDKFISRSSQLTALATGLNSVINTAFIKSDYKELNKDIESIFNHLKSNNALFIAEHTYGRNTYGILSDRNIDKNGRQSVYFSDKDIHDIYSLNKHDEQVKLFIAKAITKILAVAVQGLGLSEKYFFNSKQIRPRKAFNDLIKTLGVATNYVDGMRAREEKITGLSANHLEKYTGLINNIKLIDIDRIISIVPNLDIIVATEKAKAKAKENKKSLTGASAKAKSENIAISSLENMTEKDAKKWVNKFLKNHTLKACKVHKSNKGWFTKDSPVRCDKAVKVGSGKNRAVQQCNELYISIE
jgi:hypothetical protein